MKDNRFSPADDYQESSYGARWAAYYDEIYTVIEDDTIDFLESYVGPDRRALELAVGTGRMAIPLADRGVAVTGVELSAEMLELLKAKPGGLAVEAVEADMVDFDLGRQYPVAFLGFNTIFILLSQQRQIDCFANVARHLEPGGRFIIDCFVPDLNRYDQFNTRMGVSSISSNDVHAYEMSIHHPLEQKVVSHTVRRLADGTTVVLPVTIRYAWPSELDLMARLGGFELEDRWGWYDRRPFTESSHQHVSVYRKT